MTEAKNRNQRSIKMKTVVAAVAVLFVVGGTTAWAAGGVDAIRSWFGTAVLIDTNGTQTELEITPEGVISVGPTSFLMIEDPATLVEGQEISIFTDPPADGLHESQSE